MSQREDASVKGTAELATGMAAVFKPVSHPVLGSIDPQRVSIFLRERERYEIEIEEKRKEVPTMVAASYKVSVDLSLLRNIHFLGKFDDIAPGVSVKNLTSEHVKTFVDSLVRRKSANFDPNVIERSVSGLRVPMHIADPDARVLEFVSSFFQRLESVGCDEFKERNSKKTIALLQERVYPKRLKKAMERAMEYREELNSNLRAYITYLSNEAVAIEKYDKMEGSACDKPVRQRERPERHHDGSSGEYSGGTREKSRNWRRQSSEADRRSTEPTDDRVGGRKPVVCLYPPCRQRGLMHRLKDCTVASAEEKERTWKAFLESRGVKTVKESTKKAESAEGNESTMMRSTFNGSVSCVICADSGSDINLMPPDLLRQVLDRDDSIECHVLTKPKRLRMVTALDVEDKPIFVTCDKRVKFTVDLHVRHGCSFILRNLQWYLSTKPINEPILGRPIMEALGLDVKATLQEAFDRLGGEVDAKELLEDKTYPENSVARLLNKGVFHSDRGTSEEPEGQEEDFWLDMTRYRG